MGGGKGSEITEKLMMIIMMIFGIIIIFKMREAGNCRNALHIKFICILSYGHTFPCHLFITYYQGS